MKWLFKDMTEKEKQQLHDALEWYHSCHSGCASPLVAGMIVIVIAIFCSCKDMEYVPIENTRVEHHCHHDTIEKTDTFIKDKTTIIRELDSAAMAKYGIRLKNAERAFLIQTQDLEKQIRELKESKKDTVYIEKKVPVPVERKLNRWEQFKMDYGAVALGGTAVAFLLLLILIIVWIGKKKGD